MWYYYLPLHNYPLTNTYNFLICVLRNLSSYFRCNPSVTKRTLKSESNEIIVKSNRKMTSRYYKNLFDLLFSLNITHFHCLIGWKAIAWILIQLSFPIRDMTSLFSAHVIRFPRSWLPFPTQFDFIIKDRQVAK